METILDLLRNYGEFLFPAIAVLGMLIIPRINKAEKDLFKVSWPQMAQWSAFLLALAIFRIMQMDYMIEHGLMAFPRTPPAFASGLYHLGLVFWEDFFFAIPIYFIMKKCERRWLRILSISLISLLFGLGHGYQGLHAIVLMTFMPYFVTYHYGKKYGFGTTMLAHVMYDCTTLFTIKLLPYLLY